LPFAGAFSDWCSPRFLALPYRRCAAVESQDVVKFAVIAVAALGTRLTRQLEALPEFVAVAKQNPDAAGFGVKIGGP